MQVRQFDTRNHDIGDAAGRPVAEHVVTRLYTCDPKGTAPNDGRIAAYSDWFFNSARQGYIQCYPQNISGGRALVWTYDSDAIEMAVINTSDSSRKAATTLFTWWDMNVQPTPLAAKG